MPPRAPLIAWPSERLRRGMTAACWSVAAALSLAACHASRSLSRPPLAGTGPSDPWPDECGAIPGYADFASALKSAVAARDPVALRALFADNGRMRMNGIGGDRNFADWGFDRPAVGAVWSDLESLLALGCARRNERLYLPFMATLEGDGSETLVALADLVIRSSPDSSAPVLQPVSRGSILQPLAGPDAAGWAHVMAPAGRTGYVRGEAVRSPAATVLILVLEGRVWRIQWLGGNV